MNMRSFFRTLTSPRLILRSGVFFVIFLMVLFVYLSPLDEKNSDSALLDDDFGELIEQVDISYHVKGRFWGENLFTRHYGDIVCEGNTITSISSRIVTNFLDLEIYCRDLTREWGEKIIELPRPNTILTGSYIQNFRGDLYSVTTGEVFDFNSGNWILNSKRPANPY